MALSNAPKILRGAFVEFGLSVPPLFVVFQYNPEQLTRARSSTFAARNDAEAAESPESEGTEGTRAERREGHGRRSMERLRNYHQEEDDLTKIRDGQTVFVGEETISFDIRLDASDALNDSDLIAGEFGIAPRLATLELMMLPKSESVLGGLVDDLLSDTKAEFSFTKSARPPMVMFIWGRKKVLPVNINSFSISETEFSPTLNPLRATVSVNMTVIEGKNALYTYSKIMTEAMSVLNLANVAEIADVVVPG